MIKRGGSAAEAKTLADEFQALLLDVMFEQKDIKDENDIIDAKALPGTKKKEPAKLPSDFVTNDDFCPGCGLELKTHADRAARTSGPTCSQRDLQDGFDPDQAFEHIKPGLLAFRGWGLERQLSADRRALHRRRCATTSRRCGRRSRRSTRSSTASRDVEKPVEPEGQHARQPVQSRRRGAARISCRC